MTTCWAIVNYMVISQIVSDLFGLWWWNENYLENLSEKIQLGFIKSESDLTIKVYIVKLKLQQDTTIYCAVNEIYITIKARHFLETKQKKYSYFKTLFFIKYSELSSFSCTMQIKALCIHIIFFLEKFSHDCFIF